MYAPSLIRRHQMRRMGGLWSLMLVVLLALVSCADRRDTPASGPPAQEPVEQEAPAADQGPAVKEPSESQPVEEAAPEEEPVYLAIIWHQHQPVYFKDPDTGVYVRPWVRVHATKDYVDMAAMLEAYPDIRATFNLTPSLLRQLEDLSAGAKDLYWVHTEVPAAELTGAQKQFSLDRFFDTNQRVINRFTRYQALKELRDGAENPIDVYSEQDFLDLQLLFNLAWTDPDWLAQEPLASLVARGRDFSEADKVTVLAEHQRLIDEVIPVHRRLQDAGQIEVTMTPFAHPILPLLINTDLAREALPDIELPAQRFAYAIDAVAQVERGVALYEDLFGRPPRGMWPAEGAVAQIMVTMVAQNGILWMASDEGVLANSLGFDSFTRDSNEVVTQADQLYRPYYVEGRSGGPVAMVFRDVFISDKVGFTYSGMDGALAAQDFVNRIQAIRQQLAESGAPGPHLVSVILDGENAWEHYENDGKAFLHGMYQRLSDDPTIITVTPTEFLELAPDQPAIEHLWAGSWINHDFSTWIGEDEENRAWDYLADTRAFLEQYINGPRRDSVSPEALDEALTQMYIAEGSDWFWWYGDDQDSGSDESFDQQYRDTLKRVYVALGVEPPAILDVPIIPERAVSAAIAATELISPTIDGLAGEDEWAGAGLYRATGGVMAAAQTYFEELAYGFDGKNLYLKIGAASAFDPPSGESTAEIYLAVPGSGAASFSRGNTLLGFAANRMVAVTYEDGALVAAQLYTPRADGTWQVDSSAEIAAATVGNLTELAVPLGLLGSPATGDRITMRAFYHIVVTGTGPPRAVDQDRLPGLGPAQVAVPDLGTTLVVVDVEDPADDDYGPGAYTYPRDAVFNGGSYDIIRFQVGEDEQNVIFRFDMRGPVENPWGSPNGLSIQTFDIYIDVDGDGQGGVALLPGRNLALEEGSAWDYAVTVEGWNPGVYTPGDAGPVQVAQAGAFQVLADPGQRRVIIRLPKSILGDDPSGWRYAAMVLSQEGFPSGGVMRVRDVLPTSEQWRVGGAPPGATNHTRVIDLVWPYPGDQERWLSDFTPVDVRQSDLQAEHFARVPMFGME
jgi:alpha-amylase/alpha-mannosidase (GH57 family)